MEYLIKSTAILSLFYIFYKLFLQNETFFQSIRSYFLIGVVTAIILPLIIIPEYVVIEPAAISSKLYVGSISQTMESQKVDWNKILLYLYLTGVIIFSLRFLIQLSSLLWLIFTQQKIRDGKYILIKTNKNIAPFSFFNCIVYNPEKFNAAELNQIIKHEKIHVDHLHSIDVILSQFITIANWFNPFIWLYNKEVQKNLEFIADDFTQYFTPEKKTYQYLLLKTITPNRQLALTNNFYNSLIKKRINMLQKNRSNKAMYFKFAFIIPILIAFVFTFNTEVIAQQKMIKTVEVKSDLEVEIITKDFSKYDLEKLKTKLASKGIVFSFKKLKYNTKNEITSINISVDYKDSKANISLNNDNEAIKSIRLKIDTENNAISLGTFSGEPDMENVFVRSGNKGVQKKIIVKSSDDGDKDVIWISRDSTNTFNQKDSNAFVIFSGDDENENEIIRIGSEIKSGDIFLKTTTTNVESDNDIQFGGDQGKYTKVWVTRTGDSIKTKVEMKKFIYTDEDSDEVHKILIERNGNIDEENDIIIKTDMKPHSKKGGMIILDSNNKKPLIIVDGKEMEDGKLDDIDPNNIKTIEVLKGDTAVKKYGEKGKDGVIRIKTKKGK
jgi:bla regulator protein blaR1